MSVQIVSQPMTLNVAVPVLADVDTAKLDRVQTCKDHDASMEHRTGRVYVPNHRGGSIRLIL